jgi:hypothetical protein
LSQFRRLAWGQAQRFYRLWTQHRLELAFLERLLSFWSVRKRGRLWAVCSCLLLRKESRVATGLCLPTTAVLGKYLDA